MTVIFEGDLYDDESVDLLSKERNLYINKAIEYFKSRGLDTTQTNIYYVYLRIPKERELKNEINKFKILFNSIDEELKIALWNMLELPDNIDILKQYFTDEEYRFINEFSLIESKHYSRLYDSFCININQAYESFNIKLVPYVNDKKINNIFKEHLKNEGDFEKYTLCSLNDIQLNMASDLHCNLAFNIFLKRSNELIGVIYLSSLSTLPSYRFTDEETKAMFSYYIFKEYRGNGYCKEAISLLQNLAFNGELKVPVQTEKKYIYEIKPTNINMLCAITEVDNESSKSVLKSTLFEKSGTINKYKKLNNRFVDIEYYELSREKYLKRQDLCKELVDKIHKLNHPVIDLTKKGE